MAQPILQSVVANLSGKVRRDTLHGRPHYVAPMTMIVPGVLNGSKGPLMYTKEEISRDPSVWNGMPIVLYHPNKGGQNISAREPQVLNDQGIGTVLRTKANGRLTAEAWFDIENTRKADIRYKTDVLKRLEKGQPIGLSTGLFVDSVPAPKGSEFKGKRFGHYARNFRPDHLAVLPDQVGACNIKDGCGVLVNGKYDLVLVANKLNNNSEEQTMPLTEEQRTELVDNLITNCDCWEEDDREVLISFNDEKLTALNEQASKSLEENKEGEEGKKALPKSLKDMSEEELEEELKNRKKPAKNEEAMSAEEWLARAPDEIKNTFVYAGQIEQQQKDSIITKLTANLTGPTKEEHRERLSKRSLPDLLADLDLMPLRGARETVANTEEKKEGQWLANVLGSIGRAVSQEEEPLMLPTLDVATGQTKGKVDNEGARLQHEEEWLRSAPKGIRSILENAVAIERRERDAIIDQLVSNIENSNKRMQMRDLLTKKSVDELQHLLDLRGEAPKKPVANYRGAATPAQGRISRLSEDDKDDILPLPGMAG